MYRALTQPDPETREIETNRSEGFGGNQVGTGEHHQVLIREEAPGSHHRPVLGVGDIAERRRLVAPRAVEENAQLGAAAEVDEANLLGGAQMLELDQAVAGGELAREIDPKIIALEIGGGQVATLGKDRQAAGETVFDRHTGEAPPHVDRQRLLGVEAQEVAPHRVGRDRASEIVDP